MKEYKSFYKTVDGNEGQKCNYPTRLDTYVPIKVYEKMQKNDNKHGI